MIAAGEGLRFFPVLPVHAAAKRRTVPIALQIPLPSGTTCQLPPPVGEEAFGVGVFLEDRQPIRLLPKVGEVGKRVRSAHNAEGVSDPQSRAEASTDHG